MNNLEVSGGADTTGWCDTRDKYDGRYDYTRQNGERRPMNRTSIDDLGEPSAHRFVPGHDSDRCMDCGRTEPNYWHNPGIVDTCTSATRSVDWV